MGNLIDVPVAVMRPERFEPVTDPERYKQLQVAVERAQDLFSGRVLWNVNSTARGGGVAEMLQSLLAYARGSGVDARWAVIRGEPGFFAVTKRIHNFLHGHPGDNGDLGDEARAAYEKALADNAADLVEMIRPGDVVILHDPQTAGLSEAVAAAGAIVIWRCHVGLDLPNETARTAWNFLIPYVRHAHAYVFSRQAFAWESLDATRISIIPPSIDAFSPKNQDLDDASVTAILDASGVVPNGGTVPAFFHEDGTPGRVDRKAEMIEMGPVPARSQLVVQVSRWDRLKDPVGVIRGFARGVTAITEAHLIVAGPAVEAVADDPEGADVLSESIEAWNALEPAARAKIHLACLPMADREENAAIVNALQRRADIVVQKSLAEGFGLTVAEAMWKARPVVASRIGGIQDQVIHGETGLLIDDPHNLAEYSQALLALLFDSQRAREMGKVARRRVSDEFLGPRHLMQYVDLMGKLLAGT